MQNDSIIEFLKPVFFFCLICIILAACTYTPERTSSNIAVLHDLTEEQIAVPVAEDIIPLFRLSEDKWNGASFSYRQITDVSFTRRKSAILAKGGSRVRSSTFTRDKHVRTFSDSIAAILDSVKADTIGRPHSSVFFAIADELNTLHESKDQRRILLIYSDLMENTSSVSFYNPKTLALLKSNPGKIKEQLLAKAPLTKLDGIVVYIVNEPKNAAQDDLFQKISKIYTEILKERGATVHIVANLSGIPNH